MKGKDNVYMAPAMLSPASCHYLQNISVTAGKRLWAWPFSVSVILQIRSRRDCFFIHSCKESGIRQKFINIWFGMAIV